ncbi:MAG: tRNA-dihydrouridine synthase [bacterium]|nr:tRNA-dihydrouridine synthase [bacterium]
MKLGFWENLKKKAAGESRPIFVLAPMADVTDAAFRQIIPKYSRAEDDACGGDSTIRQTGGVLDAMWTEFVSADGLCHEKAREKLSVDLKYSEEERPIVAQLFTSNPENMKNAAKLCANLGFDGVDINMGCPDRKVEKQGAGAALMKNPPLARALIRAAKEGVSDASKNIPVSVKTRLGYNKDELEDWLPELLAENPAVVTIHARTRKEMSKVPARWERIKEVVKIRDALGSQALIFGNGDVSSIEDGVKRVGESLADGVMLGKAIFGRPDLFSDSRELENNSEEIFPEKRLRIMIEHTKLFEDFFVNENSGKFLGVKKSFAIMKKHYKAYVSDFSKAKELRMKLMETENAHEVENVVNSFLLT